MDVVALVAWEGLTYEQTAHALGIPIGTVRSRMFSARKRLAGSAAAEHLLAISANSVSANLGVSS
jgi:DNA-directed RNA polymerase specialized sigma24 family protein